MSALTIRRVATAVAVAAAASPRGRFGRATASRRQHLMRHQFNFLG